MKAAGDGSHPVEEDPPGRDPIPPTAGDLSDSDPSTTDPEPDMVFRVSLQGLEQPTGGLEEFYREQLRDLLRVVRLSFKGEPVLVDSFAFLNRPDRQIPIPRERDSGTA